MNSRLFPSSLTNNYSGSWLALWLFVPVLVVKTLMGFTFSSLNPLVDVANILKTVDGVPLDSYSPEAALTVVNLARAWGTALFCLCLLAWVMVACYRAALPMTIIVFLVEQWIRSGVDVFKAVVATVTGFAQLSPSAMINLALIVMLILAFALSMQRRRDQGEATDRES